MNDLHCHWSFVKHCPLLPLVSVQVMQCLHLYYLSNAVLVCHCFCFFNLACSALCGIRLIVILSTYQNHRSLRCTTLSNKVVWLPNACLMSYMTVNTYVLKRLSFVQVGNMVEW